MTIALVARFGVAIWGASRFPPAEDGKYFHQIASRIAEGDGYTWLWPDGAVTAAAHYPIGYPAILSLAYLLFGPFAGVAMGVNAALGTLAALAVHRIASRWASRRGAFLAGLLIALHPGLVFYTPAIMTEGVASALVVLAAWSVVRTWRIGETRKDAIKGSLLTGCALGLATLIRPQLLLLAPFFGALAVKQGSVRIRAQLAAVVTVVCVAVCVPWTIRNCVRMHSCALVSVNAGWNLYIGAAEGATGSWTPIDKLGVPPECRTVWDEAQKDKCFGAAGRRHIARRPMDFLALIPRKLAMTFDYAGAAGWYLHSSNPVAFDDSAKKLLGIVETLWERLVVAGALAALARAAGPNKKARAVLAGLFGVFLFTQSGWIAHIGVVVVALFLGRELLSQLPAALAASTVFATALTHAIFFGAGRYSLLCFPLLAALSGAVLTGQPSRVDTQPSKES